MISKALALDKYGSTLTLSSTRNMYSGDESQNRELEALDIDLYSIASVSVTSDELAAIQALKHLSDGGASETRDVTPAPQSPTRSENLNPQGCEIASGSGYNQLQSVVTCDEKNNLDINATIALLQGMDENSDGSQATPDRVENVGNIESELRACEGYVDLIASKVQRQSEESQFPMLTTTSNYTEDEPIERENYTTSLINRTGSDAVSEDKTLVQSDNYCESNSGKSRESVIVKCSSKTDSFHDSASTFNIVERRTPAHNSENNDGAVTHLVGTNNDE
ncbi:hypothetical protein QAD02_021346 [Eretmocerus hayati]|uniref:Uncharacterized protein n=1 Tax=Eretmocerus hayati TaxID=131215 RepID=A0ACC2PQ07_9HYME|nr:hypothetical protein QAD02_021346 [Eretmocerus hayati]